MDANSRRDVVAAAAYVALTLVFTWPLVRGLHHDVPGGVGDPLLNAWILAWDATHFGRGWWNANIYSPHPLSLAYSEHLAAQALQIAPVYWLTGNAILCYNLLFLSTFALSGLGAFLLVRELTGRRDAAFVAGLAYAFAPYRIAALPHLQVLSSAWMPFVLFGFRRYFASRRALPLAGAATAWLLQNLSCGYYLMFFTPVVLLYLAWELTTRRQDGPPKGGHSDRRLWMDGRTIGSIALACAVVAAATAPFVIPYMRLRDLGFTPRSIVETQQFSADVYGYLTAESGMRVWGSLVRARPKAEGSLFPGMTVLLTAVVAIARAARQGGRRIASRTLEQPGPRDAAYIRAVVRIAFVATAAILLGLLLGFSLRLPGIQVTSLPRALVVSAVLGTAALVISRKTRDDVGRFLATPEGIFAIITAFAIVMSFGPQIHAKGRVVLDTNLYALFYRFVPGFDGLRVPARFAMIVALGLSVLAGLALARFRGTRGALVAGLLIAAESFAAPIGVNDNPANYVRSELAPLPPLGHESPPVYRYVDSLPGSSVIVELPLGEPAFDVRYMFHSTRHWRPLVNGYSGGSPPGYWLLEQQLQDPSSLPDIAAKALERTGATHAIVHEAFYRGDRGRRISDWLRGLGAQELAVFGADRVFALPRALPRD